MPSSLKETLNYYQEFKQLYFEILKDFGFDYEKDREARDVLLEIIQEKGESPPYNLENILISFKDMIKERNNIFIYGCGPSLEETVEKTINKCGIEIFLNSTNLAADGASLFLREKKIPLHAIFSDLDGITEKEFAYSDYMIIHGHGDNMDKLKVFKNKIVNSQNVIGTTQVEPLGNIINPGGFTDGDRILYFLRSMVVPKNKLYLIGMDFKSQIGKYSKPEMNTNQEGSPIKQKKLRHAIKLIEWLLPKISCAAYFVNTNYISNNINYLSIEEFINMSLNQ
jgi:hypothetical protein